MTDFLKYYLVTRGCTRGTDKDTNDEVPKELVQDTNDEVPKELVQDTNDKVPKELLQDTNDEVPRELVQDTYDEVPKEIQLKMAFKIFFRLKDKPLYKHF